ncbi:GlxA family transcriptional regulator [Aliikangiella marina]|uniref:GlxA family transcriptional regulator n=1 Tax=Aliikangiella marina TaxID=1712262 RepID=A0A545TEB8_9GAMM|nr:GlxA family transcriptional regulator [Aliikangiella marina]TQV75516.1 GlxA family transcriptional regulator [Aliikangiella marina]
MSNWKMTIACESLIKMREIAILMTDNCLASSVTGPHDLFNMANRVWQHVEGEAAEPLFRVKLVSEDGKPVTTSSGIVIHADEKLAELSDCDFLMIAAYLYGAKNSLLEFIQSKNTVYAELRRLHHEKTMIGAYCSATFVLAASGLLKERKATTSWWLANSFRRSFPEIHLTLNELVVEEQGIYTAGATTSYIHLCLKIIEKLVGAQIANQVSKVLLVDNNRLSQLPYMQFIPTLHHKDSVISKCQDWIQNNLSRSISLEDMAAVASMSKRNFIRRFKKAVGETPLSYLQRLRIEAAKRYLETTDMHMEQIIEKVGYEDSSAFRRVFQKITSLTPSAYRSKFIMSA